VGREWERLIPETDKDIYALAGFRERVGFGARPAVLVIDVQYRTTGDHPAPIREAITTMYPTACGEAAWRAIDKLQPVLASARRAGAPVIYPHVAPKKQVDVGRFGDKHHAIAQIPEHGYEFVAEVEPQPGDVLIPKRHASAFFGTALASYLIDFGVDTVIVTGATTSGCVRATVADAFSYNFRTIVVDECVYDRLESSHAVSLYDMDAKYADVVDAREVIEYLDSLSRDAKQS
jgi:nicotinamidase-related amidase